MLRTVTATRYVTPLREGGSLPALVEADDDGLYVVKLLGAGHGRKALVAELLAGEIARHLGLPVPDQVLVELDGALAKAEPNREIQDLLGRSAGTNIGLDFLPGALAFSPAVGPAPDPDLAAAIVWLDAYTTNVDRTPRNPNLIVWHRRLHLIDHGSALYIHHTWRDPAEHARRPFEPIRDHVLLPFASSIAALDARLAPMVTRPWSRAWPTRSPTTGCRPRPGCPIPTRIAGRTSTTSWRGSRRRARSSRRPIVPGPRKPFEYAIVRVVPRVDRGEAFNAGHRPDVAAPPVPRRAASSSTPAVLAALAPDCDPDNVRAHLDSIVRVADGDAAAGPIGRAVDGRAIPLAGRAVVDDHPAVGGPHRPDRRRRGDPRAPVPDARPALTAASGAAAPSASSPPYTHAVSAGHPVRQGWAHQRFAPCSGPPRDPARYA